MKRFVVGEGWRKFLFEVAVVVIGVLLALGAQQAVDALTTRAQIKAFRESVDAEIAYDLAAYQDRLEQSACLKRRLDELDRRLLSLRAGSAPTPMAPIGAPDALTLRTSAWDARTDAVFGGLPLDQRIDYGAIYADFALFATLRERESAVWQTLQEFDDAADLDRRDLLRLRGLITNARRLNRFIEVNWPAMSAFAARMAISPRRDASDPPSISLLCKPLYRTA